MTKPGTLATADFDAQSVEWMIRTEDKKVTQRFVVYRAGVEHSRHADVKDAYSVLRAHCPDRGVDLESSMSR